MVLHGVLALVTLGFWLPIPLAVWVYRRGARKIGRVIGFGYGGFLALITLIVVITLATGGGSDSGNNAANAPEATTAATTTEPTNTEPTTTEAPPPVEVDEPPGDNMNYRTRQFVKQLRGCQAGIAILASSMQSTSDLVELSSQTKQVKDICSSVRTRMSTMDTNHFDDQALTVEIAIDEYTKGLDDVRDFIDTAAPSKAANAADHFRQGHGYAAQGIDEINARRAVYGLPPLKK